MRPEEHIEEFPPDEPQPRGGEFYVAAGRNNQLIIFGRDRPADILSGYGFEKETGTIHIVVGRKDVDPSFKEDSAFAYITMKTDVDKNLEIDGSLDGYGEVMQASVGPAIITKSNNVRIVFRDSFRLTNESGKHHISLDNNFLHSRIDKRVVIDVGGTGIEFRDSENKSRVMVGPLAEALDELAQYIIEAFNATAIADLGNMGAVIPNTGSEKTVTFKIKDLLSKWRVDRIDGKFVKNKG
jgi:hypothetical protein